MIATVPRYIIHSNQTSLEIMDWHIFDCMAYKVHVKVLSKFPLQNVKFKYIYVVLHDISECNVIKSFCIMKISVIGT